MSAEENGDYVGLIPIPQPPSLGAFPETPVDPGWKAQTSPYSAHDYQPSGEVSILEVRRSTFLTT